MKIRIKLFFLSTDAITCVLMEFSSSEFVTDFFRYIHCRVDRVDDEEEKLRAVIEKKSMLILFSHIFFSFGAAG